MKIQQEAMAKLVERNSADGQVIAELRTEIEALNSKLKTKPSEAPSPNPSSRPSVKPSAKPSGSPSFKPSAKPSAQPTLSMKPAPFNSTIHPSVSMAPIETTSDTLIQHVANRSIHTVASEDETIAVFYNLFLKAPDDLNRVSGIIKEQFGNLISGVHRKVFVTSIGAPVPDLQSYTNVSEVIVLNYTEEGSEMITLRNLYNYCLGNLRTFKGFISCIAIKRKSTRGFDLFCTFQ